MDLISIQIFSFVSILVVAVIGGSIPLWSARFTRSERFFSFGNAFAGGLFLGIGFMHLLPEGIEQLAQITNFQLGMAIATSGFAVLLLIDRVLFPDHGFSASQESSKSKFIYPYVLLGMLCIHAIVEGVALGLTQQIAGAVTLMAGILFHKGGAAFALILTARVGNVNLKNQRVFLALFAIMAPLGIFLGTTSGALFTTEGDLYLMMQGVFNSFAAGTFIYIAVFDIINKELTMHQQQLVQPEVSSIEGVAEETLPAKEYDRYIKFFLIVFGIVLVGVSSGWLHSAQHADHTLRSVDHIETGDLPSSFGFGLLIAETTKNQGVRAS